MGRFSDLIKMDVNGCIVNIDDSEAMSEDCVIMAEFEDFGDGNGYKKFGEITYEDSGEYISAIINTLTALKLTGFYITKYLSHYCATQEYKIFDFDNSKSKIRLILHGFKQDLSYLKDIYNNLI